MHFSVADPVRLSSPRSATLVDPNAAWRARLLQGYAAVRGHTERLTEGWSAEDQLLQSMPDASPTKWHLAHTAWFFEAVVLQAHEPAYRPFDPGYAYLFNSYYEALGPRHPRPQRGLLSRPSLDEVRAYRHHVDTAMRRFVDGADVTRLAAAEPLITLGLQHEQQHQELMLTDLLHAYSLNPLRPALRPAPPSVVPAASPPQPAAACGSPWVEHPGGVVAIGHDGPGFAFDNEGPRHRTLLAPFRLAAQPVRCGDYLAFVRDGGYRQAALWLSDGWAAVQAQGWQAPPYWVAADDEAAQAGEFAVFGLQGLQPFDANAPVSALSFYEAAAYAEWAGARLPTEFEWEAVVASRADAAATLGVGQVWEWTRSAYAPYPGFRPLAGAVAEYNGKFMVGQQVLRGGSAATPPGHVRATYRNFFPPAARWQFSGLRLAQDA